MSTLPAACAGAPPPVALVGRPAAVVGGVAYVNWSAAEVAEVPLTLVTVISTTPAACAGAVAVICVVELTVKDVAAVVPKETWVAPVKAVPVTVTMVPPPEDPDVGLIAVTVGIGMYMNWSAAFVAETPPDKGMT